MRRIVSSVGFLSSPVLMLMLISGCAEKGPILLNVAYQQSTENAGPKVKKSIGLSQLRDSRGKAESTIGLRTIPDGQQNDFVVQGTVAGIANASLKSAFKGRGILTTDIASWDCTSSGVKFDTTDMLIGGEIKSLWLESKATVLTTHMKAVVQLKVCMADAADKGTVRTIDTNSVIEQDYIYSHAKIEAVLSEAITAAIEQLFKDESLKDKLQ